LYDADNGDVNLGDDEEHDEMLGEVGLPQRGDDNGAGDSESVSSFPSSEDRPAISSREKELRLELEIQRARMTSGKEEFEREKERRLWQQQQPESRPTDVHASVALPRMANDDDVLTFFNTFERLLVVNIMHPMFVVMMNQHLECTVHLLEMLR